MLSKDTQVCISVAAVPSNFGTSLHNALYKNLNLDYIYKACATDDISMAIAGVRALGFRGCSVSMPFKQEVIKHLDSLDLISEKVGAVNTV